MAINPVATVTRDFLLTTRLGGGEKSKLPVIFTGINQLQKNTLSLVPAGRVLQVFGQAGAPPNSATFITGLVAYPIQNLGNFSNAVRRFQVDRAGLGTNQIEIAAMGRGEVKARVRLAATIARLAIRPEPTGPLNVVQAFSCFTNADADTTLTLPNANRDIVGLEYFFVVNPAFDPGVLTIACGSRDVIQIRESQTFRQSPQTVIESTQVVEASSVSGKVDTNHQTPTGNADKTIVLACRGPRLWVAENVAANPDNTAPLDPEWTITSAT